MTVRPDGPFGAGPLPSPFVRGRDAWLSRLGNLRNVVRQELVARQLAAHLPPAPARVLDVGAGQGTQAVLLARRGLDVLGLEPDERMREAFRHAASEEADDVAARLRVIDGNLPGLPGGADTGTFDVVCCHGVLMYLPDPVPALAELASATKPGGILSVVARNADSLAMRPALRADWNQVIGILSASSPSPAYRNEIGVSARADRVEDLAEALRSNGMRLEAWYGIRVFTDGVSVEARPPGTRELAALLDAEELAGRADPFRRVAPLVHLIASRSG